MKWVPGLGVYLESQGEEVLLRSSMLDGGPMLIVILPRTGTAVREMKSHEQLKELFQNTRVLRKPRKWLATDHRR